ncbi:MAG: cyanophycin synthetase, partial [Polyangiaceae bacterium]
IHALGLDVARACEAMGKENGAPGRLERCDGPGDDLTVLVDYAHTPDALERVLASVRSVTKGRILCVFGCGGDRDPKKRGPMGEAVAKGADVAIITSDNPRSEDPKSIAAPIEAAMVAAGMKSYVVELDRKKAIHLAVSQASAGDVVLVAGKGHEDYQIVGSEKRFFDDRVEARSALAARKSRRDGGS